VTEGVGGCDPSNSHEAALELIDPGVNDCEIGRRLGISRVTIRGWRTARAAGSGGRTTAWTGKRHGAAPCFRCAGTAPFDLKAYAYLLGIYLRDWDVDALSERCL